MPEDIAIPAWVNKTPLGPIYSLAIFENEASTPQRIDVTRDEYTALKAHLAAIRGYTAGEPAERVAQIGIQLAAARAAGEDGLVENRPQQIASYLVAARWLYRHFPEAVVCTAESFDDALEEIADPYGPAAE